MQVDQPLCYECLHRVQDEVELSIRQAEQDCKAYEAALARLRQDDTKPYTDEVCCASTNEPAFAALFAWVLVMLEPDLVQCTVVFSGHCCFPHLAWDTQTAMLVAEPCQL